jgi:DNA end-binding protein Ku
MARAFWKGSISFGMVVIPIRLAVATRERPLSFRILHKKCLTRPKQVWFCEKDEQYFDNDETVRGYEFAKDQFVVIEDEELDKLTVPSQHLIEIEGFTLPEQVDPIYDVHAYYVEPEKHGEKPYALLKRVLSDTGRVAIGKITLQKRERACMLRPSGSILTLHTLYHADEVRPTGEAPPTVSLSKEEIEIATKLVNGMVWDFKPAAAKDAYHAALEKLIKAKLKGKEVAKPLERKVSEPSYDLLEALKASVAARRAREKEKVKA